MAPYFRGPRTQGFKSMFFEGGPLPNLALKPGERGTQSGGGISREGAPFMMCRDCYPLGLREFSVPENIPPPQWYGGIFSPHYVRFHGGSLMKGLKGLVTILEPVHGFYFYTLVFYSTH